MERHRGQGSFEYVLMLSGVLLVVITIVYMMQGSVSQADNTLDAQMKSAGIALDQSYYVPGAKSQFLPSSPADGAGSTTRPNISVLITVKDTQLYGLTYNWNGTNYSIYDSSLVLAINFDDASLVGDLASKAVDASLSGNNGMIYGNTQLLLHMDENTGSVAYDEGVYRNNGTCYNMSGGTGITNCEFVDGKNGKGILFNGNSSYIKTTLSMSGTGMAASGVTYSAWVRTTASGTRMIAYQDSHSGCGGACMGGIYVISGKARMQLYNNTVYLDATSTGNINDGTWHNVVGKFDPATRNIYVYVDGKLNATKLAYTVYAASPQKVVIGAFTEATNGFIGWPFNGTIDEVMVTNRSLSASEILAHYNTGRAKHANWEVNGKWQAAMRLDGTDDWMELPASTSLTTATGAMSVEAWVKPMPTHLQGYGGIYNHVNGRTNSRILLANNGAPLAEVYIGGSHGTVYGPAVASNQWSHVAYVYNGTHEQFFVNGSAGAAYAKTGAVNSGTTKPTVGWGYSTHTYYHFNGSIDEVRVWNRSLSPQEIEMHYRSSLNRYTSNAWFFEYRNDSLAFGTYNYTLYTNGGYRKDSASETRTVKVCSNPLVC